MDEHLDYEKNSVAGNNSGNSRNGYEKKCVYSVLGINMEGQKEILGTWISEGAFHY